MAKRIPIPLDPKEVDSRVRITDFGGMACGLDLHDTDPGETYYQVNVVPFHPGELRVRRGFVVCQFEVGSGIVLVAPPLERYAEAESSIWMHSDARRARDIDVSVWQNLVITVDQPTTNWHKVSAANQVVLTGVASARFGNAYALIATFGLYHFIGSDCNFSKEKVSSSIQFFAVTGVYPSGVSILGGVSNMIDGGAGSYVIAK